MLKNYFTVSIRAILRNRVYSLINILGLAMGIALCILAYLYVYHEWTYDTFHKNADRIYRVYKIQEQVRGQRSISAFVRAPLAPALEHRFADIEHCVRLTKKKAQMKYGDKAFHEEVFFVDTGFFDVFTFPLLQGQSESVFMHKNSIVLSERMARKYFGDEYPLYEKLSVKLWEVHEFIVTGIAKNPPENSSIQFDFLLPYQSMPLFGTDIDSWNIYMSTMLYVQLPSATGVAGLEARFPGLVEEVIHKSASRFPFQLKLQPITEIHLNPDISGLESVSDPIYAYILSGIALGVLLIACINFMNLSIAISFTRAKEIGMRKVVGASRLQLVQQFWCEAFLLTLISCVLGAVLAVSFLPTFNRLMYKRLSIDYYTHDITIVVLFGLIFCVSFIAGGYPAAFLSGFRPVESLKNTLNIEWRNYFRQGFVLFQFILSTFFIISTILMYSQIGFLKSKNLGFDAEQIVVFRIDNLESADRVRMLDVFKNELPKHPAILGVSGASFIFNDPFIGRAFYSLKNGDRKRIEVHRLGVDSDFFRMLDIDLDSGRGFRQGIAPDGIVINNAWKETFKWDEPMENYVRYRFEDLRYPTLKDPRVIGVVEDFHSLSLHHAIKPTIFYQTSSPRYLYVKIRSDNISTALSLIKDKWNEFDAGLPFEYMFLDKHVERQYREEERWGQVVAYASCFAIVIACLGALGLTMLAMARRTKEIGIRKILGASVMHIISLVSRDFLRLVFIGNVIAWPIVYYVIDRWLQDFSYRIDPNIGHFLFGGGLVVLIVFLTVGCLAVKVAKNDPVKAIRYE